jgi:esterase/lipase/1-acyl-sn-glycerol-3-phosphate acyltransferase
MNLFAFRTTGLAIKTLSILSKARIHTHGEEHIPDGPLILVINHFTRIETFIMPYVIYNLTRRPVWSLADAGLFKGALGGFLDRVGAVSTNHPDRDRLIVKTLLTGEAPWIIYPEGRMVKNKKIVEKGRFMISASDGKHPPHTGAANLALRSEFYRARLHHLLSCNPQEAQRLLQLFHIASIEDISPDSTQIVPVNITYYPLRAQENALSHLAARIVDDIPERVAEEIMTEGAMLLFGVDIDIRFGQPISVADCLTCKPVNKDMTCSLSFDFDDPIPSKKAMQREARSLMQQYMTSIYRMTTVNHDHLFAGMLNKMPYRQFKPDDFKRRVFLVARQATESGGCHFHSSLQEDQLALLTDDRYNRARDFIDIAVEKGVLLWKGQSLQKNISRIKQIADFHRARLDNPVMVMANAIEPLTELQQRIRKIAWLPSWMVRRRIAQQLQKEILAEFEQDYLDFYDADESKPRHVGRPFLVRGKSKRVGIVLLHGYMAAPYEVKALAEFLGQKGFWVYVPRLKGHGTTPEDLAIRSYQDWRYSVNQGYAIINAICERVIVGGFSTGAGLALDLATRIEDLMGVFAISAPMRLQDVSAKLVPAVDAWNKLMGMIRREGAKKQFIDNHPENPDINYLRNPIAGVRELEKLMGDLEPRLEQVRQPALVVQSLEDPVVNPKGSEKLFKQIASEEKTYVVYNFKRHGILLGHGAPQVYRTILNFIDNLNQAVLSGKA